MAKLQPRKRWVMLGWVLAAGFLGVILWLYYFVDSSPPEDADLQPASSPVPDDENGFVLLQRALPRIEWPEEPPPAAGDSEEGQDEPEPSPSDRLEAFALGQGWDPDLVRKTLEKNRDALEGLDAAIRAERFVAPPITNLRQVLYKASPVLRRAGYVLMLRAGERWAAGDGPGAVGHALAFVRLGGRMQASGDPNWYLMGGRFAWMGRSQVLRLVQSPGLGRPELLEALRKIEGTTPSVDALRSALRAEYAYESLLIDVWARGEHSIDDEQWMRDPNAPIWPWRSNRFLLPQHCRVLISGVIRSILDAVSREPWQSIPWQQFLDLAPNRWFPGRNGIGRLFIASAVPTYRRAVETHTMSRIEHEFLRLIFAIRGHRLERGELPAKLDDLVPSWIAAVPVDPFDGRSIRYDRARRILWSIGNDGKDEGGVIDEDAGEELQPAEPTRRIPFE